MNLNILQICRQMRFEAISRLFSSKRIVLAHPRAACDFLVYVGSAVGDITNLQFVIVWENFGYPKDKLEAFLGYLVQMVSLRSFELTMRRRRYDDERSHDPDGVIAPIRQRLMELWPGVRAIIAVVEERGDIEFTRSR